jgi:hypothetical protein
MDFKQQDATKHDSSTLVVNILLSILFSNTENLTASVV